MFFLRGSKTDMLSSSFLLLLEPGGLPPKGPLILLGYWAEPSPWLSILYLQKERDMNHNILF